MKNLFLILALLSSTAQAGRLADTPGFEYDLRFTNPLCEEYRYEEPIKSASGGTLIAKPKNAYCKPSDFVASATRPESPQYKLIQWIRDPSTREIFFAYLSFSNSGVAKELCAAISERNVKVRFIIDDTSEREKADQIMACRPKSGKSEDAPELHIRGHQGGLGYAHNKLFMVNPRSKLLKIVFSSGNLSSGVALHHENWHFITVDAGTYFGHSHLCLMDGMLRHGKSLDDYRAYIRHCRSETGAEPESDIQAFFIPGDGDAATRAMTRGIQGSSRVWIGAHRFSYGKMLSALSNKLGSGNVDMRIIVDDDVYWAGMTGDAVGPNEPWEYENVASLAKEGAQVKYMETNHGANLLHHNKFLIFDRAVFAGAGNLTGTAFTENFENFYFITIPDVVARFQKQYLRMWDELATAPGNMPSENTLP